MKKGLIAALIAINVGLLGWAISRTITPAAAQNYRGAFNCLAVSGKVGQTDSAVYMIDLGRRKLAAWHYDPAKKRMVSIKGRDLVRDFRRDTRNDR